MIQNTTRGLGDIMQASQSADMKLVRALREHSTKLCPDWSYAGDADRVAAHGLIQYPAMMVPSMQRDILSLLLSVSPKSNIVLDPFVGSGTALTETIASGRSFIGFDINPLAILISRVKAKPVHAELYAASADEVLSSISADTASRYCVTFQNQAKWFRRSNSIGLSRIRRAIERIDNRNTRRFMWVTLAETIRRCSNSRTSTYKLHIRNTEELSRLDGLAIPIFTSVLRTNVRRMLAERARLRSLGILVGGKMRSQAIVMLDDISKLDKKVAEPNVDIVITSPPYGDNRTTVPYGQFSYLALRWIPHHDIDPKINPELLDTTHTLDTASLGGGALTSRELIENLSDISPSFSPRHCRLQTIDREAANRWAAYCRDLSRSVANILSFVRPGGYLAWTIGQRRIRSINAPLMKVLNDLHVANRAEIVTSAKRIIPTKRMPSHNAIGSLMLKEHICFYRKH
jgi:hypothetical protein